MSGRILFITTADQKEAEKIARALVEKRLVACANIIPKIKSVYWWKGKVEESGEALLLCKTTAGKEKEAMEKVKEMHSYGVPCIEAFSTEHLNPDCKKWMEEAIK